MLRPPDEVRRRKGIKEDLLVVGSGISRIDPILSFKDYPFGVGIPAGEHRVAGSECCAAGIGALGTAGKKSADKAKKEEMFHA